MVVFKEPSILAIAILVLINTIPGVGNGSDVPFLEPVFLSHPL